MSKRVKENSKFEELLEYLKNSRGFDFTGYKRTSLARRVDKRIETLELNSYSDYQDYLEAHPDEFDLLFNTILINVTSFFRDEDSWNYLESEVLPRIVRQGANEIRVWSAGCASGPEVYSIAILLCEIIGEEAFREKVKIYATDLDEEALAVARQAFYDERSLESLPKRYLEKYFVKNHSGFAFRPELRRSIIFGRHDLLRDAPISKLDLLICRNTLMYLNAETQTRILARLHFALKPDGFLFLGKAEMLLSHGSLFEPVHLQHRIFSKVTKLNLRERLLVMAQASETERVQHTSEFNRLRELSFENSFVVHIVVDAAGVLQLANARARSDFGLSTDDLGRNFKDLELSYRPLELRSLIDQAGQEKRAIKVGKIARVHNDQAQLLDVQVTPLFLANGELIGTSITFAEVTDFYLLYDKLRSTHEELETTNEELESTNEELETTNEELQSANEELETTNEELQSANEELETTNAELQSTNEELESTNVELLGLAAHVDESNKFLHSVLSALKHGMIVLDSEHKVLVWNEVCEDMWGMRSNEVLSKNFLSLEIGLPLDKLKPALTKGKSQTLVLQCISRRGKAFDCMVRITPLIGRGMQGGTVLLLDGPVED